MALSFTTLANPFEILVFGGKREDLITCQILEFIEDNYDHIILSNPFNLARHALILKHLINVDCFDSEHMNQLKNAIWEIVKICRENISILIFYDSDFDTESFRDYASELDDSCDNSSSEDCNEWDFVSEISFSPCDYELIAQQHQEDMKTLKEYIKDLEKNRLVSFSY